MCWVGGRRGPFVQRRGRTPSTSSRRPGRRGRGAPSSPAREGGRERPHACHSEPAVTAGVRGVGSAETWESRIPKRE